MKLLFDYDYIKYQIAAVGEKRSIDVKHTPTGRIKNFPNRTEFYGHWKKKEGGWLAEKNLERQMNNLQPFSVEEFEITDRQEPEPIEFVLSTVKNHIKNVVEHLGADSYYGYIGKGDSFRVELSTILKYKGNRDNMIRPIHLEEIEKYLITHHNAKIIRGIEADDRCTIDCINDPDLVLVAVDKDYCGNNLKMYTHEVGYENNPNAKPVQHGGFGKLWLNNKGDVKGTGYLFWLWQVCSSDDSDNYAANSASDIKWGAKSAYKALVDCTNEKEAWDAAIKIYKKLYPEPKLFTGWRGDTFEIDWKYVLNENCVMSKMMTSEDYKFNLDEELGKYGIKY